MNEINGSCRRRVNNAFVACDSGILCCPHGFLTLIRVTGNDVTVSRIATDFPLAYEAEPLSRGEQITKLSFPDGLGWAPCERIAASVCNYEWDMNIPGFDEKGVSGLAILTLKGSPRHRWASWPYDGVFPSGIAYSEGDFWTCGKAMGTNTVCSIVRYNLQSESFSEISVVRLPGFDGGAFAISGILAHYGRPVLWDDQAMRMWFLDSGECADVGVPRVASQVAFGPSASGGSVAVVESECGLIAWEVFIDGKTHRLGELPKLPDPALEEINITGNIQGVPGVALVGNAVLLQPFGCIRQRVYVAEPGARTSWKPLSVLQDPFMIPDLPVRLGQ